MDPKPPPTEAVGALKPVWIGSCIVEGIGSAPGNLVLWYLFLSRKKTHTHTHKKKMASPQGPKSGRESNHISRHKEVKTRHVPWTGHALFAMYQSTISRCFHKFLAQPPPQGASSSKVENQIQIICYLRKFDFDFRSLKGNPDFKSTRFKWAIFQLSRFTQSA